MNKILLVVLLVLLILPAGTAVAYDHNWGIKLNALSLKFPTIAGTTLTANQSHTANIWYKGIWNNGLGIEIDGGAVLNIDWVFGMSNSLLFDYLYTQYSIYPSLNKFNFFGQGGAFGYRIGRFATSDPGNLIINAPIDGLEFSIDMGAHILKFGAGYTGLQFHQDTAYSMTLSDVGRSAETTLLASSRIIEYGSWSMPSVALWFNPSIYFLAVQDLTSDAELTEYKNKKFHSMFLEFRTRGFLGKSFIYSLALAGQYGFYGESSTVLAGIGKVSISWLPSTKVQIGVEGTLATGDNRDRLSYQLSDETGTSSSGKQLNQYLPVSIASSHGYVLNFELGNMISLSAFLKHSISKGFTWELRTTTLLRTAIGPVSSDLVPASDKGNFIGQEILTGFGGNPNPYFRWSAKIGALIPGELVEIDEILSTYFPVIPKIGCDFTFSL